LTPNPLIEKEATAGVTKAVFKMSFVKNERRDSSTLSNTFSGKSQAAILGPLSILLEGNAAADHAQQL
jgi:hypothetical protein